MKPLSRAFEAYLSDRLSDPGFRADYEDAGVEARLALEILRACETKGLPLARVAKAARLRASAVRKLEERDCDLTVEELLRVARVLGFRLRVELEPRKDGRRR